MEKITLTNGLRIILDHDDRSQIAHFMVLIGSGTRYETPEDNGISHFIEHMLFKGTAKRDSFKIAEEMDYIGARYNAYTSKQYTCVYSSVLSKYLSKSMDIIFDIVSAPALRAEDIEIEKGVVISEIEMCEDDPDDLLIDGLHSVIWRDSALGKNILGTREIISQMTEAQMRAYMASTYVPERMVIAVGGNYDRNEVLDQINEYFGGLKNTNNPINCVKAEYTPSIYLKEKDFEQHNLSIGFNCPYTGCDDNYPFRLLSSILGGSSSSRLFRKIREEAGLVYSINAGIDNYLAEGFCTITMGVSKNNEIAALEQAYRILEEIRENGITEDEFNRVRNNAVASLFMSDANVSSRIMNSARDELIYNKITSYPEVASLYEKITIDEINSTTKYFDFSNATFGIVGKSLYSREQYENFLKSGKIE